MPQPYHSRPTSAGDVHIAKDVADKQRDAACAWLLTRAGVSVDRSALNGNDFRGTSLVDIARHCLQARGINALGMTGFEIAGRAASHSTSDFPKLMENVAHKTMAAAFKIASATWRRFCAVGEVSDFRPHNRYRTGGFGDLREVRENGTFQHATLSDAEREVIQARTKGRMIGLSRHLIVNDDMHTFASLNKDMAHAASRTVENDAYAELISNPTLSDGTPLFHASRNNLNTSGAAPSMAGFDRVRTAMARQQDVGANDFIDVRPAVWLGPVEYEGAANAVNDSKYDPDATGQLERPNTVRGLFKDVVGTPRLTGNVWYAFADPEQESAMEVAFLNGEQEPQLDAQDGFEFDGILWRVRLDYAVGAVGWRGAQKVEW